MIQPAKKQLRYDEPPYEVPQHVLNEYQKRMWGDENGKRNFLAGVLTAVMCSFILCILAVVAIAFLPPVQKWIEAWRVAHTWGWPW